MEERKQALLRNMTAKAAKKIKSDQPRPKVCFVCFD
jgi:hypothetical protein